MKTFTPTYSSANLIFFLLEHFQGKTIKKYAQSVLLYKVVHNKQEDVGLSFWVQWSQLAVVETRKILITYSSKYLYVIKKSGCSL